MATTARSDIESIMDKLEEKQRVLDYDTKEFTIEFLVDKFRGKDGAEPDFYVPSYQRRFNWDERRQSRFIETLLIGLPIPFLFFADRPDGRLEVVDGNQRLNTCKVFLDNELELIGLEGVEGLDGFKYRDFSLAQQRRFRNRSMRSVVLSQKATEDDLRDLFDRINTGSLIAEPVEIRRGVETGPITELIDTLAKDETFRKWCPMTETARRKREGEELITRLFAFSDGLDGYRDRVGAFLKDWLKNKNNEAKGTPILVEEYKQRFHQVMTFVDRYFPHGFAKNEKAKTTPRGRFDAIAVGVHNALAERPELLQDGPELRVEEWLSSDDFFALTPSGGTNVRNRIERRTAYVKHMLLGQEHEAAEQVES